MSEKCIEMIRELTEAFGPSGYEEEVLEVVKKYTAGLGEGKRDHVLNYYLQRQGNTGKKPLFVLDGHTDEVGLMVHSIKPNGMLRIVELGGFSANSLISNKVRVRTADGRYIPGIIASKPPHFMSAAEKAAGGVPDISSLIVDVGSTSYDETVNKYKIRIGEPIVPDISTEYDEENGVIFGKAFDDRIGAAAIIETMNRLKGEQLNVDVLGVFSTQEEVGCRGAKVAAEKVEADIAIVFEGCPADDTFTEPYAIQTAMKKGPMLRFIDRSVIVNPRFQRFALDLATKHGIPVQASVREGGGNNASQYTYSAKSTPAIVIGIPVRYPHSQNCMIAYSDFEAAVQLAVELIRAMDADTVECF